ncbi:MAG: D-aminoacyl-tRNA deacylase [Thermoplasmatota archaeon]
MKLIVRSATDPASVNITDHLLELGGWMEGGEFEGSPARRKGDGVMVTIPSHHLYYDDIDAKTGSALGLRPSVVIFASRHTSSSNLRTLTTHPIGNFGAAEMGGRPQSLVPAAPREMTHAYRLMRTKAKEAGLQYRVSLEATHHGPHLSTPALYIEIGSDEAAWREREPGRLLAEVLDGLLSSEPPDEPVALGVGGGHYVPRISDVAWEKKVCFGHMLPSYILEQGFRPELLELMVGATPGARMVYFHRKAIKTPVLREMEAWFRERGIEPVASKDLV